jgi:hypothetical protein
MHDFYTDGQVANRLVSAQSNVRKRTDEPSLSYRVRIRIHHNHFESWNQSTEDSRRAEIFLG